MTLHKAIEAAREDLLNYLTSANEKKHIPAHIAAHIYKVVSSKLPAKPMSMADIVSLACRASSDVPISRVYEMVSSMRDAGVLYCEEKE